MIEIPSDQPLLVFGGPYSNLRATLALRVEAERLGIPPERTICTGDIVAYCAEPEETATALRDWGCFCIAGNCEEQLAAGAADCGCNFGEGTTCDLLARGWYPFADQRVTPATRAWMAELPRTLGLKFGRLKLRVVHGGIAETARWIFASRRDIIAEELAMSGADIVLAGHCGVPFIERVGGGVWFNPGVIGMPANDATADVWYGLIVPERDGLKLMTRRLSYDNHGAAAAMRRFRHADGYARTLVTGIWPSFDVLPEAERAATGVKLKQRALRVATCEDRSGAVRRANSSRSDAIV